MASTTTTTTLPAIPLEDVQSHNTSKSCYVLLGNKVFDVTDFVDDHPGGADLIVDYAGTDITEILKDELSHAHTDIAYDILDEYLVGYLATGGNLNGTTSGPRPSEAQPLPSKANGKKESTDADGRPIFEATGMSCAEDLSKDTDIATDYKTHKFLDLDKPLLMQVWYGGFSKDFYLAQVHRPRHYRGGDSAPLFGNFLEPLSKTSWYVIPIVWLPCVAYGTYRASEGLSLGPLAGYWFFGLCLWSFIEYGLHRCLFHLDDYLPNNRVFLTLHFLIHGIHHYLPMDKYRLVMPPTLFVVLATPFWYLAHAIFFYSWHAAVSVYCGGVFGYICYDLTHYFLHHKNLPAHYKALKKYHLEHHFADYQNGFGVTSKFWDTIFGTELQFPAAKIIKSS